MALAVAAMEQTDYGLSDFSPDFPTLKEVSETFADGAKISVCKESDWKTAFRLFKEWKANRRLPFKIEENLFPKRADFMGIRKTM